MSGLIGAVIFDCDGTLVDSEPITTSVLVDFVSEFGLQLEREESIELFAGRDMTGIMEDLESRLGSKLPPDFVEQFRNRQARVLESDLEAIDGAENLLAAMTLPICVASNAPRAKISLNLRVTGLTRYFSGQTIFSAYDINVWKPSPDLFLHAAEKMGQQPGNCVVVEDSRAGIEAAARAGTHVICYVPEGSTPIDVESSLLAGAKSAKVVQHLDEIESYLSTIA